jgi:FtsP/CotA-like multicopper oxidase with cupredoxin domain
MAIAHSGSMQVRLSEQARWYAAIAGLALSGCGAPAGEDPPPINQPAGWADEIRLPQAVDLNPDPHVLEINLEARESNVEIVPGQLTKAWTYDGGIPGPLIRAQVGDRLIVHFKNSLPEPSSIHWHGLRIPSAMDGVPDMPTPAVPPGGSFDYDFVLPDAGTYWYHPHFDSGAQVGNGLYGPIVVDDPAEPKGLGDEAVLMLSDIGLDQNMALEPADSGGDFGTLFGREGNFHLVNGRVAPTLHVRSGARQRWRVINASRARYEQLVIPGVSFTRIGSDGGMLESPQVVDRILLTPAQRADVVFEASAAASPSTERSSTVTWLPYDRGFGTAYNRPNEPVMTLAFVDGPEAVAPPLPPLHREIAAMDLTGATPVDISLTLNPDAEGKLAMGINGEPSWLAAHLMTKLGERQLWTVKNTFDWDHPFHLHGFFFQVLDVNGVPPAVREWRDTVNVPVDATVRFAVHFDERPGMWMFHCHILDHADAGMMGMVHLE